MKLAFYKAKGNFFDMLIRVWTRSKYSHCELLIDGESYSSSPRDGGARILIDPNFKNENWDFVEVSGDVEYALEVFNKHKGKGYDWLGILFCQIIPLDIHDSKRVWCSEICAAMLKLDDPSSYSPQKLYSTVTQHHTYR